MKKGYTLIEIVVVFLLMAVLYSITTVSYKGYKNLHVKIESDYGIKNIIDFIDYAKQFCRENNTVGYITFNEDKNEISFQVNMKIVKKLNLGNDLFLKDIALNKILGSKSIMQIKSSGMISNPGKICVINREGEEHIITICVGTSYVRIKK